MQNIMVDLCDGQHTVGTYHKGKVSEMRNVERQVQQVPNLQSSGHLYADPQGAKIQ
jgi:hypothetical protein